MPPSSIDIECGLIIVVEEVFVPQPSVDKQGLFEKCLSCLLHLGNLCRAGALEGADFQGVVIGCEAGGFVEGFSISGDGAGGEVAKLAVEFFLEPCAGEGNFLAFPLGEVVVWQAGDLGGFEGSVTGDQFDVLGGPGHG